MRLLLHVCCGPCAVYPVSVLQDENIEFKGLFFNPNIHPRDEFERRRENVEKLAAIRELDIEYNNDFGQEAWEAFSGAEEQRCRMCYSVRFERAAAYAKEKGYDAFSTTLLVSPYQKHELIKELGDKLAQKYGIDFFYRDFRPGFRQGQQQAKEMGLYRQKFCGCIISYNESPHTK